MNTKYIYKPAGRVKTAPDSVIRRAFVALTDSCGAIRTIRSGSFGCFKFDGVTVVGETYIFDELLQFSLFLLFSFLFSRALLAARRDRLPARTVPGVNELPKPGALPTMNPAAVVREINFETDLP